MTPSWSVDGKLGFLNAAGKVHLIADIVGCYEPHYNAPVRIHDANRLLPGKG